MYNLRNGLQKQKNDVYVAKRNNSVSNRVNDLYDGIRCSECGGTHFRYEQPVKIGVFDFYGYTCLGCGNLIFMDFDAMLTHPMSGKDKKLKLSNNKTKLLPHFK